MKSELLKLVLAEIETLTWDDFTNEMATIETEIEHNKKIYWLVANFENMELSSVSLIKDETDIELVNEEAFRIIDTFSEAHINSAFGAHIDAKENYDLLSDYNSIY